MKILLIVAVVGLLVLAGVAVVNAVSVDEPVDVEPSSCGGGCSVGQVCSNAECGVRAGGSCGCGR